MTESTPADPASRPSSSFHDHAPATTSKSNKSSRQASPSSKIDEAREKPVREQLRTTYIEEDTDTGISKSLHSGEPGAENVITESMQDDATDVNPTMRSGPERSSRRKRSMEELGTSQENAPKHIRKRSREERDRESGTIDVEDYVVVDKPASVVGIEDGKDAAPSAVGKDSVSAVPSQSKDSKIPFGSAFNNASTQSPFLALAGEKSHDKKLSGFGSLSPSSGFGSTSTSSGFASLGTSSKSAFASSNSSHALLSNGTSQTSGFAGLENSSAKSVFSSTPQTGFASLSSTKPTSGFAGGSGAPLKSFTAGNSAPFGGHTSSFGSKPKAFTEEDEETGSGDDDAGTTDAATAADDDEEKDERFFVQDVETGEEHEETLYQSPAKLFIMDKQWKERGTGNLKINITKPDGTAKRKARFLMRAQGSHRVVLNSPISKDLGLKAQGGDRAVFLGFLDEKPTTHCFKLLKGKDHLDEFMKVVDEVLDLPPL